jgi:hypothetical protein
LNRKTSLLRIVPTACGQAADTALGDATSRPAVFAAVRRSRVFQCSEIAHRSRRCVAIDSRSDPTSSRCQISRLRGKPRSLPADAKDVLCGRTRDPTGGARRDRTDDLLLAKQALSQLSYGPVRGQATGDRGQISLSAVRLRLIMVGLGRFELPTSRLSSARSNQLSYKPWGQETAISHQKSATARLPSEPVYRPPISDP